jgi:hypothetical protein
MSHQHHWLERHGSEDSHARALWAAGTALGRSKNDGHRNLCALLFQRGLPTVEFQFPESMGVLPYSPFRNISEFSPTVW